MIRQIINKLKIRSKKYLQGAKGQPCVRCGVEDGTIVGAHYTGLRVHLYGKGTGTKPHDILIADLCSSCHFFFDHPRMDLGQNDRNIWKTNVSEEFLHLVALTLMRRCEQGILYTNDMSLGGK